ncbi:PREDICTED: polyhomeotic-like protein 3 [Nanorana parkeri]|uniref:polyhomeotic-like protein 3 n=1 Tax=Nanorana parkeri TaxID=125878 RepID=UPI0008546C7B|nr:PREDICTED: polyhomeotic-like protein 3 [Nanorana parkeri]
MENEHIVATSSTSPTTSTTSASHSSHPPPISVYSSTDRHAVQVIQQALNRPPSSAAQYLQQMYAAQQQHLMLQTAALQQQHLSSAQLQSLASVQQAGVSGDRQSVSPTTANQQSNVPQPSLNLSSSPPPTQIISRSQTSSTTSSSITQKTMLLGSTSPTLSASQAQMYLRAQMLIFTPAATVAAVQSDIPVISSSTSSTSCQSSATQVQNLTLRSPPILEISCPQSSPQKISNQDQPLAMCHRTTLTKAMHADSNETSRKGESPGSESRCTAVTRTASLHQLIAPVSYSSVQHHSLTKHPTIQLHTDPPKLPHHQMILQQQQQIQHRHQIQTITLHNPMLESSASQHCVPMHSPAFLPLPSSAQSHHSTPVPTPPPPSPTLSHCAQQSVVVSPPPAHSPCQSPTIIIHPQAHIQPQPPLLVQPSLPSRENSHLIQTTLHSTPPMVFPTHPPSAVTPGSQPGSSHQQSVTVSGQPLMSPIAPTSQPSIRTLPPSTTASPNLPTSSSHFQALPLQSMQAISVQPEILTPGQVLVQNALLNEEELPAAEALVQLPFQRLPPPQTVAVNLHIPPAQVEPPVVYHMENMCSEEVPVVQQDYVRVITQTSTPPTLSPPALPVGSGEELPVDHILQGLPSVVSSVSASVIKSPLDSSYASIPAPPLLLPAATTRSNSTQKPNSIPGLENKVPQAIVKPQILTHVIEGFVIQEGLEPFPVNRSSLMVKEPAKGQLPMDEQIMNMADMETDIQSTAKLPDNSTDTELDDLTAEEGVDELDCEMLECEFCGKTGYPNKFLRSKRFCSLSCSKRSNVNGTKRLGHYKAEKSSRWNRKAEGILGRRGRRSHSSGGSARDHYLRQLPSTYSCREDTLEDFQEELLPAPMTTRLRRQSEREQELRLLQVRHTPSPSLMPPDTQTEPSLWTVEDVCAFIHSLPGCHDIADEFRTQEIDGQALLLLKEDHLMSTMNIKLGPALKICARINSLKET